MHLLITLGSSYAIVPEAYLLGNGTDSYTHITVLTTTGTAPAVEKCHHWFQDHAPDCHLRILTIDQLADIRDGNDHAHFEEALFRSYFHALKQAGTIDQLDICLAGGFKTISSAAHQTADLLGCRSLFHITMPFGTRIETHAEILQGIKDKQVNLVELGTRPGWPTLQQLATEAPALEENSDIISIENLSLREKIFTRLREANQLAQSEGDLATLPFPQLARWAPSLRAWLNQALDPATDADWLLSLPKVELHCHLGGFATHGDLLAQVRAAASAPCNIDEIDTSEKTIPPNGWPLPATPYGLENYRNLGDNNGSAILKDPGCLEKQIQLLYQHLQQQNIHYAEIRCSPANYTSPGRSPWTVLTDILHHFKSLQQQAKKETPHHVTHINLIIIATRKSSGDFRTGISQHLALAAAAADHWVDPHFPQVVSVDLAGYESQETRAHYYREEFTSAHRAGLGITIHAGENDDAEGIWSAIIDLNARRLGHALHLKDSPNLLKIVADRNVGIEMCPYANLQIVGYKLGTQSSENKLPQYPLLDYLRKGLAVTVNTDNIGISAASLTENYLLLPALCPGITRLDILRLIRNSIDQAFCPKQQKDLLLASHIPNAH